MTGLIEETPRLLKLYKQFKEAEVRERLVDTNLGLVHRLCRRFSSSQEPYEDLFQVGVIGLLRAIEKFDLNRENSFAAFAIPEIIGEILNYFRDHGRGIKIPRKLRRNSTLVRNTAEQLTQVLGRWPTVTELGQATGLSVEEIYDTFEMDSQCSLLSLDSARNPQSSDDALTYAETLGGEDKQLGTIVDQLSLKKAITCLDSREQIIVSLKFYKSLSQAEIGQRLGISQMHVSRLLRGALVKLRCTMTP